MKIIWYTPDRIMEDPPEALLDLLARPDGAVWVDMTGPSDDDVRAMRDIFHFHPLAIEDTMKQAQRPKLEEYEGYFFMTLHAMPPPGQQRQLVSLQEIDLFFAPRYVVTVHPHAAPALDEARVRLSKAAAALRTHTDFILYTIVDTAVDTYFPVIDRVDQALDRAEEQIFKRPTPQTLNHLFTLKRSLLQMRRVAAPLRDMFNTLTRRDLTLVRPETLVYFRDVYDHLLRITDMIDTHRDLLTGAVEIYLSAISNRLNEVVKVLTVITALSAPLAVITGIYGMNFERTFPPFEWPYGFAATIFVMAAVVMSMLYFFRRRGWL